MCIEEDDNEVGCCIGARIGGDWRVHLGFNSYMSFMEQKGSEESVSYPF